MSDTILELWIEHDKTLVGFHLLSCHRDTIKTQEIISTVLRGFLWRLHFLGSNLFFSAKRLIGQHQIYFIFRKSNIGLLVLEMAALAHQLENMK